MSAKFPEDSVRGPDPITAHPLYASLSQVKDKVRAYTKRQNRVISGAEQVIDADQQLVLSLERLIETREIGYGAKQDMTRTYQRIVEIQQEIIEEKQSIIEMMQKQMTLTRFIYSMLPCVSGDNDDSVVAADSRGDNDDGRGDNDDDCCGDDDDCCGDDNDDYCGDCGDDTCCNDCKNS